MKNQIPKVNTVRVITKKDSLGQVILPGVRVAFNYSGDVASGVVEKITGTEIHIRRDGGFHGTNPISKVKKGRSCLVLSPPDQEELLTAYEDGVASLRQQLRDDFVYREKQLEALFQSRQTGLADRYAGLLNDLKNAWDVDEMKMLVEHHFGDIVE